MKRVNEYKEQLKKMIELAEKQVRTIKVVTGFTDTHMFPQLQAIKEAKEVLESGK